MSNHQGHKSLKRDIIISIGLKGTRIAILEDSKLVEFLVDRDSEKRMVGDIYNGVVGKVLPGMQAAFVDIGLPKQGFLHVSDMGNDIFYQDVDQELVQEEVEVKKKRKRIQSIQDQLKEGQKILVQITKEPIGTKGPRVTTDISLPGRLLVYAPFDNRLGISRKIENPSERARIRDMIRKIVRKNEGVIVRTAAEETSAKDFETEYHLLVSLWRRIKRKAGQTQSPAMVYKEAKMISGLLRDVFTSRVDLLVVDSKDEYNKIKSYLNMIAPDLKGRLKYHEKTEPVFTSYGLDDELRRIFNKKIWLKTGGYLVIEQTEALVTVDVNTGRYTGERNQEETILRTNLDAAREIARQVRLRDLGGIIVCDFIDMESKNNQQAVLGEFRKWLKFDRAKTKAFELSPLGLVEMSRQRVRSSLYHSLTDLCPTCKGSGRIFTPEVIAMEIEWAVRKVCLEGKENSILIRVHPVVALFLMEEEKDVIKLLENKTKARLELRDDPLLREDSFALYSMTSQRKIEID